jgi:hypothetical protein
LLDTSEALTAALWGGDETKIPLDEAEWRPSNPERDKFNRPRGDYADAAKMREVGRALAAGIVAQFRRKILAARRPVRYHGVRRGRDLSERRLVDTMIELKSGARPTRPDFKIKKGQDTSLAVAVVGDESGSMAGFAAHYAAVAMLAIADAFETLGSPVMCCGVRSMGWGSHGEWDDGTTPNGRVLRCHRVGAVAYDLFKDWDESLRQRAVVARFAAYRARGSTPLSDGVAYALSSISERPERHRVVVVLTDGDPNCSDVMRRLVRQAREAGIWVIGVGIGPGTDMVRTLYPDKHVVVNHLRDLPRELLVQVESIVFPKRGGVRAALDSQINAR